MSTSLKLSREFVDILVGLIDKEVKQEKDLKLKNKLLFLKDLLRQYRHAWWGSDVVRTGEPSKTKEVLE